MLSKKQRRQLGRTPAKGSTVSGGFKAGKRRRGNSLLKKSPVTVTRVQGYDITDDVTGVTLASNVKTFTHWRPVPKCECGNGTGHCPIHGFS